jgi:2-methylcitrate dehydratase PrpD
MIYPTKASQTRILAQHISKVAFRDIPVSSIVKAKECLLDTLGCAFGAIADETNQSIFKQVRKISCANETRESNNSYPTIWGTSQRMPLLHTVLYNGTLAHTLEFDDVHRRSKVHAGSVVIPASLAMGERLGSSGKDVLRAVVLGYEVAHRIGFAIGVLQHRSRGWHATSTIGCFGAATAAGVLLCLNPDELTSALGLAGTQAGGLWAFLADGAGNKRLNAGMASYNGTLAAVLAQAGLIGPSKILEAEDGGLFPAMSEDYDFETVSKNWGKEYMIEGISIKPFSCCRSTHPIITALLDLRGEYSLNLAKVKNVEIDTYAVAQKQCDISSWPETSDGARMNMRYIVAVTLSYGQALASQFKMDRIMNKKLQALAPPVKMRSVPEFNKKYPEEWGCRVRLHLDNGKMLEKTVKFPLGDPENPLSYDDLLEKFLSLADGVMLRDQANILAERIHDLDQIENIRDLFYISIQ